MIMIQCLFFFANRNRPWVGILQFFFFNNNNHQDSLSLYVCVGYIWSLLGESVLVFFMCVVKKAIGFSLWVPKWKWEKEKENNFRFSCIKIKKSIDRNSKGRELLSKLYVFFFSNSSSSSSFFLSIVRVRLFSFSASRRDPSKRVKVRFEQRT